MNAPKAPLHLVLTPEQSAAMRESGIGFFTGTPSRDGRATLLLFECGNHAARAASRVAQGTHRATKKKPNPARP
jgi:hypothetical protein